MEPEAAKASGGRGGGSGGGGCRWRLKVVNEAAVIGR